MKKAVISDWDIEIGGKERHFRIIYANTFDEPMGGLMIVLLTKALLELGERNQEIEVIQDEHSIEPISKQIHLVYDLVKRLQTGRPFRKPIQIGIPALYESFINSLRSMSNQDLITFTNSEIDQSNCQIIYCPSSKRGQGIVHYRTPDISIFLDWLKSLNLEPNSLYVKPQYRLIKVDISISPNC